MEQKSELQVVAQGMGFYDNKDTFDHVQRVAKMFTTSELVPDRYKGDKNIGNCVIALEIANRMGASPLMVMQHLNVIKGTPSWSSTFLIATMNASNKFSPLRYEDDDKEGGRTRAVATDKLTNTVCYGAWVSMEMAKAEGWIDKQGSKWKTMPELMRRYRAASFFTKQFAPEVSMGLHTTEEVMDITHLQEKPVPDQKSEALKSTVNETLEGMKKSTKKVADTPKVEEVKAETETPTTETKEKLF